MDEKPEEFMPVQSPKTPTADKTVDVMVHMNDPAANKDQEFPDNFIKTYKYEWYTFLFINLFHQFKKVSNFFFLVNAVYAMIPGVSPFSPIVSIAPLLFVVGVAMIKDGYEDFGRHRADAEANSIVAHVVRENKETGQYELTDVQSRDVQVGDIMYIKNGEEIRADVLLLSSTGAEGSSFIETCNLDGETNLKNRKAVPETWEIKSVDTAVASNIRIKTKEPSPHLLHWGGVLLVGDEEASVGIDQFLYRSAILKNTEEVWGVVVYAGVDTKMFRNLEDRPPKMSGLDVKLNWLILAVVIVQHCILLLQAGLAVWFNGASESHWYCSHYIKQKNGGETFGFRYLAYFILMSYMIPISLFVTIELCKVAQAKLMEWDHEMFEWMHGKWQHCTANTSNLNEQLSQVKFIFSDKTGTLTENVMKYKLGDAAGLPIDSDDFEATKSQMAHEDRLQIYMRALALCHTVQPFDDADAPSGLKYDGPSPDELALVDTAKLHGVELRARFTRSIRLRVDGSEDEVEYPILATLEFTPDRKMMSIVVKNPSNGKIEIYTKGADSFVKDRLNLAANAETLSAAQARLDEMAATGLRTLMVCYRDIPEAEFTAWNERFIEAGKALENRSKIVDEVCLELEKELLMVGITAIEDKLQDKVPETIQFFLDAGVVIWMLTGDKRETALTIAETSSLANRDTFFIDHIDIGSLKPDDDGAVEIVERQLRTVEKHCDASEAAFATIEKQQEQQQRQQEAPGDDAKYVAFVIDGPALTVAMKPELKDIFIDVSQRVRSAICCRLTPLQKASVVKMFQTTTGHTALAIGDGANDVSMISEGKVGVGIVGLEGAQAALAADYAIPRFKHLKRLCAIHGRFSLVRNNICITFSFFKNFVLATTLALYSFYSGMSGASIYDGWLLTFYNIVFTSLPPWVVGMVEKDAPEEFIEQRPKLFHELSQGAYFSTGSLMLWFGESVVHGMIVYYMMFHNLDRQDMVGGGRIGDFIIFSTIMNGMIIFLVLYKLSIHVRYWQSLTIASFVLSVVIYFAFVAIYSAFEDTNGSSIFYNVSSIVWNEPKYWLFVCFGMFGLTVVDLAGVTAARIFLPRHIDADFDKVMENEKNDSASPQRDDGARKNSATTRSPDHADADDGGGGDQRWSQREQHHHRERHLQQQRRISNSTHMSTPEESADKHRISSSQDRGVAGDEEEASAAAISAGGGPPSSETAPAAAIPPQPGNADAAADSESGVDDGVPQDASFMAPNEQAPDQNFSAPYSEETGETVMQFVQPVPKSSS